MKEIPLTQNQVAIVSEEDYDDLIQFKWYASRRRAGNFYARRKIRLPNGRQGTELMHRRILGLQRGDKREGDHGNHSTLDNRRENLRVATHQQNLANQRVPRNTLSGFKGVCRNGKKWRARVRYNGKKYNLGSYPTPELARAAAYAEAAPKFFGDFACF